MEYGDSNFQTTPEIAQFTRTLSCQPLNKNRLKGHSPRPIVYQQHVTSRNDDDGSPRLRVMLHLSGQRARRGGEAAGARLLLPRQYSGLCPYILHHQVCRATEQTGHRNYDGLFYAMGKMQQLQSTVPKSSVAGFILCICFVCRDSLQLSWKQQV